jgi:tRNA1Val (adenine37-N6)-methyltransferase
MANTYFRFKQFVVYQDRCAMKVSTDACVFGAWMARVVRAQLAGLVAAKVGGPYAGGSLSGSLHRTGGITGAGRILDVGAGTGLLSLMVAQQNPSSAITGVELQHASAVQGAFNMAISPWVSHLHMIEGDINQQDFPHLFDVIISNPPFFEGDLKGEEVGRNLARHAETLTLSQLTGIFRQNLTPAGVAGILLPFHRMEAFLLHAADAGFYCRKRVMLRQTSTHGYFRAMLLLAREDGRGKRGDGPGKEETLVIKEGETYTQEFVELLKDYYLYL